MQHSDKLFRALKLSVCLSIFSVFALLFIYQPFWGLMDDAGWLSELDIIAKNGYLQTYKNFLVGDIGAWGMFRPFYFPVAVFLYGLSVDSSLSLYMANAIFVFIALFLLAKALYKSFFQEYCRYFLQKNINESLFLLLFFLACFLLPWGHSLFHHPSLQEKIVFCMVALNLFYLSSEKTQSLGLFKFSLLFALLIFLGISSKSQFIIFLAVLFVLQLWKDLHFGMEKSWTSKYSRSIVLFCLSFCAIAFLWWIANSGAYTKKYGWESLQHTIHASKSLWLFLLILAANVLLQVFCCKNFIYKSDSQYSRNSKTSPFEKLIRLLFLILPSLMVLAFLVLMLPWGLGGYLNAFVMPLIALCFVQMYFCLQVTKLKKIADIACIFLLIATPISFFVKERDYFATMGDLKNIIYSESIKNLESENAVLFVPCLEGADRVQMYLRNYAKSSIRVIYPLNEKNKTIQALSSPTYWLNSFHWCSVQFFDSIWKNVKKEDLQILAGHSNPNRMQLLRLPAINKKIEL